MATTQVQVEKQAALRLVKRAQARRQLQGALKMAMLGLLPQCQELGLVRLDSMIKLATRASLARCRLSKQAKVSITKEGLLKLARQTAAFNARIAVGSEFDKMASAMPSPLLRRSWTAARDAVLAGTHPVQAIKQAFVGLDQDKAEKLAHDLAGRAAAVVAKLAFAKVACSGSCRVKPKQEYHGSPAGAKQWVESTK
jgi:hypothetical protein